MTVLKRLIEDLRHLRQSLARGKSVSSFFLNSVERAIEEARALGVLSHGVRLDDVKDIGSTIIQLDQELHAASHEGNLLKLYHGTTEALPHLRAGEDLTDEFEIAESYALERARQRGKTHIYVYEFHVMTGTDVGDRFYNADQGHHQWSAKRDLKPAKVTERSI